MSSQWHMQAARVLQSDLIYGTENMFMGTMSYCAAIPELVLHELAQKAEAE